MMSICRFMSLSTNVFIKSFSTTPTYLSTALLNTSTITYHPSISYRIHSLSTYKATYAISITQIVSTTFSIQNPNNFLTHYSLMSGCECVRINSGIFVGLRHEWSSSRRIAVYSSLISDCYMFRVSFNTMAYL